MWQNHVKILEQAHRLGRLQLLRRRQVRIIERINDLATLKPELAQEWSEKNEMKPTEVSIGSHKKVIWKCRHGHEWEALIKSRTINGTGCLYCSHNKVLEEFNDFATQIVRLQLLL